MKYVQPYGISDPDASYINGHPPTGTMGSIPPAASIEHPQREVVNLIADAGFTPNEADLRQLGKGVQSSRLMYAPDTGAANNFIAAIAPVPDAYVAGMVVRFKALRSPTGACTLNAGRGAQPILRPGGAPMTGGEWYVGDMVTVIHDGAGHWLLPGTPTSQLTANRDYYVSPSGNDSNDGLTAGSPFLTLQRAQNQTAIYNLNGYNITIHVANGTYTAGVSCGVINGTGTITYLGNQADPLACVVHSTLNPAFALSGGRMYVIDGFSVKSTVIAPGAPACGVWLSADAVAILKRIDFGLCLGGHIAVDGTGLAGMTGPFSISGSAPSHVSVGGGGSTHIPLTPPSLAINAAVTMSSAFVACGGCGNAFLWYSSIANPTNVTTPKKYLVQTNGIIHTNGAGGEYFPGPPASGWAETGGQYV